MTDESPEAAVAAMQSDEKRAIGAIAMIAMLRMLGLFALLPVLSLYAASLEGATPMLIGMAVGGYGLTQAAFQIPLGALSDRVGRFPVIIGGLAVFALGSAVAAFSDSIHGVIAGRLMQGAGAISATLMALVADSTRVEVRTRSMAFVGVGIGTAFILAIIAGPLLARSFGVPGVFAFGVVTAVAAAATLMLLPKASQRPRQKISWDFRPALRPELLRLNFYVFLLHAILVASFVALPFVLSNVLDMAATSHWKITVSAMLLSLPGAIWLILRDEREGKAQLIGNAVLILVISQAALTFGGFSTAVIFVALALFFTGFNFLEASLPARLSILADEDARGASLGLFSSAQFLGAFAGGLIGGRFLGASNPADVFFVCMLLAAIWLALQSFGRFRPE